jgi:transposase
MAKDAPQISDEQWIKVAPLLPQPQASPRGGRKPAANRPCFEGLLWIMRSGARWKDLPRDGRFPSYSTCRRRLHQWEEQGIWLDAWRAFLGQLDAQGRLDWQETFADGSFAPAKKGAKASANPAAAKVQSGWWWSMAKVFLWEFTSTRPRRTKRR